MDEQTHTTVANSSNLEASCGSHSLLTPTTKLEENQYINTSLNTTSSHSSKFCQENPASRLNNSFESFDCSNNEFRILQTPNSGTSKSTIEVAKSISDSIFKNNEVISSTPLVNSSYKNQYNTPEHKRSLFDCANSNNRSRCTSLNSDKRYLPVSSPSSSEILKLNDSRFLNDSSSIYCQQFSFEKSSLIKEFNENDDDNCEKTFCDSDYSKSVNSVEQMNESKWVDSEQNFFLNDNGNVKLKFKSFDLLPGIKPLND